MEQAYHIHMSRTQTVSLYGFCLTPRFCSAFHATGGITSERQLQPNPNGDYPTVPACSSCAQSLTAEVPVMPAYALANDNLMLREPHAFRVHGHRLSPVTFTILSLARMVARKIIAEQETRAPSHSKQKGLLSNTIVFQQSRCRELVVEALPEEPRHAADFLANMISIALAGAEPEDLEKAEWAQVPRDAYLTAARFCVAHSRVYEHLSIDEESAKSHFQSLVPSVIKAQAVKIDEANGRCCPLSGPADAAITPQELLESVLLEDGQVVDDVGLDGPSARDANARGVPAHTPCSRAQKAIATVVVRGFLSFCFLHRPYCTNITLVRQRQKNHVLYVYECVFTQSTRMCACVHARVCRCFNA